MFVNSGCMSSFLAMASIRLATKPTMLGTVPTIVILATAGSELRPQTGNIPTAATIVRNDVVDSCEGFGLPKNSKLGTLIHTIPVLFGIIQALANSHNIITIFGGFLKHVLRKVINSLFVHIMSNNQPRLMGCFFSIQVLVKNVLRTLDGAGAVMAIIFGINVIQDDMVAEIAHVLQTAGLLSTTGIWRTHVRWKAAQNVSESDLIPQNLDPTLFWCDFAKILMRPGMTGYLVSTLIHAFDHRGPGHAWCIYGSFGVIVARDEESHFCIVFVQQIEEILCVPVRAIVESQGNISCPSARPDNFGAVWNLANFGSWDAGRWRPVRRHMSITVAVIDLAIRRAAVGFGFPTVA